MHIFNVVIIIWNLSVFKWELQLEVKQKRTSADVYKCQKVTHIKWDVLIPSSLRLLLKA